jgi:hypothetical protein
MIDEKNRSINSLPEGMDEIIRQVQNDNFITEALINNKNFYNHFNSVLTDLNKLISEKKESLKVYSQISVL